MSSTGDQEYYSYISSWERHPRSAKLDFLHLEYPKHQVIKVSHTRFPCHHKTESASSHNSGQIPEDWKESIHSQAGNLRFITDLLYTSSHNQAIIFDRLQRFAQITTRKLEVLEDKIQILLANQEATAAAVLKLADAASTAIEEPKPIEQETLRIQQELSAQIQVLSTQIRVIENVLPNLALA